MYHYSVRTPDVKNHPPILSLLARKKILKYFNILYNISNAADPTLRPASMEKDHPRSKIIYWTTESYTPILYCLRFKTTPNKTTLALATGGLLNSGVLQ